MSEIHVLVVDDEKEIADLVEIYLVRCRAWDSLRVWI